MSTMTNREFNAMRDRVVSRYIKAGKFDAALRVYEHFPFRDGFYPVTWVRHIRVMEVG